MQQPDYNTSSQPPYYNNNNYPPTPHPNPSPPPTYASAPPYNYPPTPHLPQIPDPIPNPNFPQFDPQITYQPPIQPDYQYPHLDSNRVAPNYPQLGSQESNYPKFDQFGLTQVNSGANYAKFDQFGSSRVDLGLTRVDSRPQESNYAKFDQFGTTRVDYGSDHGGYGGYTGKVDQFGSSRVDSGPTLFDYGSGQGGYGGSRADYPQLSPREGNYPKFDNFGSSRVDSGPTQFSDGVYAYQGGKTEPYGARGTGAKSWGDSGSTRFDSGPAFDDFGRPIGKGSSAAKPAAKVARAVPKAESEEDVKGGVQKFRVKLLAESGGQSTMEVLCQIGLDGIRMLDPATSRTLRIYPLETVTRYEILDSTIFAFWAKSPVDIEPKRIRLKSNSYTSSTILDIVTAATIQFKEIGGRSRPAEYLKPAEQPTEKKKGFGDWMNIMKPGNEEKDHWVPDEAVSKCTSCGTDFNAFVRRHHCRNCGDIFCDKCTQGRTALTAEENAQPVRVCDRCLAEVTHRLNIAKETASRPTSGLQSHEDLAKKLQEEMERNRRSSSGSRSDGSSRRMKEVACPTCTVHLQVQVPSSGSETIECGVCQHPFLVSAR